MPEYIDRELKILDNISEVLPTHTKIINISCLVPDQIIEKIKSHNVSASDLICLRNADVWRYGDDPALNLFFYDLKATILIFHIGYTYRQVSENVHEIPWPHFLFVRRRSQNKFVPKPPGLTWGVGCLNNGYRLHRLILGHELWKSDLITQMVFTQNVYDKSGLVGFHRVLVDNLPDFADYESMLPIRWQEPVFKGDLGFQVDKTVNHDAYEKCYANIVTESETQALYWPGVGVHVPILSEKSFKPFLAGQLAIFLASPGHLARLKELGFETFDSILPQGYDQFGMIGQIKSIVQLVRQGRQWFESIYYDHLNEIKHNYDFNNSYELDQLVIASTKDLVNQALSS